MLVQEWTYKLKHCNFAMVRYIQFEFKKDTQDILKNSTCHSSYYCYTVYVSQRGVVYSKKSRIQSNRYEKTLLDVLIIVILCC